MVKYSPLSVEEGVVKTEPEEDANTAPDGFHSQRNRLFALFAFIVIALTLWTTIPNLLFLNQSTSSSTQQTPLTPSSMGQIPLSTPSISSSGSAKRQKGNVIAAYFTAWSIYARGYTVSQVDASKLTHILYAFANLQEDGSVVLGDPWADTDKGSPGIGTNLYGNLGALAVLKKTHRHVKVSLSIGGWTWSTHFSGVAGDSVKRQKFISTALQLLKDLALDGIDVDWEYPKNADDANNYVTLLKELRAALNDYAKSTASKDHYLLSAALPAGESNYNLLRLKDMNKYLDLFYIMCYDFAGSWDSVAGHQSNLHGDVFSCDKAIKYYIKAGVSSNKIVMGAPMYGRCFENTDGIGKPYNGVGPGSWEAGIYDYKVLPLSGAKEITDNAAGASYCYNETTRTLVSYDTDEIVKLKAKYVKDNKIGGLMFWELSGDRKDDKSLLLAAYEGLGGSHALDRTQNVIKYPSSKYDNIRAM